MMLTDLRFLAAGAARVIASLWLVQDDVSATMMPLFYHHLRTAESAADALRQTQLAIKETYAHPYFWSPFALFGQR